jgi:hypothetical protein
VVQLVQCKGASDCRRVNSVALWTPPMELPFLKHVFSLLSLSLSLYSLSLAGSLARARASLSRWN